MSTDLRHRLGRIGEDLAFAHLQRLGYTVVERNHRTRFGEIDLIVRDDVALVFVEVKTRRASAAGRGPWESLHPRKRRQVRRMAAAYLTESLDRPFNEDLRFDAIGVIIDAHARLVRYVERLAQRGLVSRDAFRGDAAGLARHDLVADVVIARHH